MRLQLARDKGSATGQTLPAALSTNACVRDAEAAAAAAGDSLAEPPDGDGGGGQTAAVGAAVGGSGPSALELVTAMGRCCPIR